MNPAMLLMGVYIVVTFVLQGLFFLVSEAVDKLAPDWSLLAFLILFLCAYGFAWPIAVHLTEPKAEDDQIEKELLNLKRSGKILSYTVERRKDAPPFIQVTRAVDGPTNLHEVIGRLLGDAVPANRISVGV